VLGTASRSCSTCRRRLLSTVAGLAALVCALAPAAAARQPALVAILAFRSSAAKLPYRGAAVTLTVRVRNAERCTFYGQKTTASSLVLLRSVSCSNGSVRVRMPAVPNRAGRTARLTYQVRVRGARGHTVRRTLILNEGPAPRATLTLSTRTVPAAGGDVELTLASTNVDHCSLTAEPVQLWAGANPTSVSCNGVYAVDVPASATTRRWTVTFTATGNSGEQVSSVQTLTQTDAGAGGGLGGVAPSSNWAGYVLQTASIFTEAGGSWTVPQLDCAATPNAGVGIWVGIGGVGNSVLLQTGTTSSCANGVQVNTGWTEEYPSSPNQSIVFTSVPIATGDVMQASVYQISAGRWETRLDNLSTALSGVLVTGAGWGVMQDGAATFAVQGTAANLSYSGATSAEWIVEAYNGSNGSQVQCADFGTVTFTNLTTSLGTWSLDDAHGLVLVQDGATIATPSSPSATGFSVSYAAP
jgi:hypothetical protein